MKAISKFCILIIMCVFMSATFSYGSTTAKKLVDVNNFKVGPDVRYFSYEEDEVNVKISGVMYGFGGEHTYHGISKGTNNLMTNTSFEYLAGNLDYDGQTQSGTSISEDTEDWIVQIRESVGYDFLLNKNLITPYIGIAYRYWNDDIGGTGGYEREIKYWYSPIGLKTLHTLSEKWIWGLTGEYDLFWSGKVKSHLSDVDLGLNDPEVDQDFGDGYGLRFSAYLRRDLAKIFSLTFESYFRYWVIDNSDRADLTYYGSKVGYVYEPANDTTSYGLRINFRF